MKTVLSTFRNVQWIAIVVLLASAIPVARGAEPPRIVSTDGTTTETLFALGAGEYVVARDSGSLYPAEAAKLPDIGTGHQLNAEAIIAQKPTLIIGKDRDMSKPGFQILESTGAEVVRLSADASVDAAKENIRAVAKLVGKEAEGETLVKTIDDDLAALAKHMEGLGDVPKPRVLMLYLRPGTALLLGNDSNAAAMAKLAGANYALSVKGYRNLNPEALVAAQPDVYLCFTSGLDAVGGVDAFLEQPGIAETPGGKSKRVIAMDDLLLGGFGPRLGKAALELFDALHHKQGVYVAKHDHTPGT
ncbi:MAG: hypothetical protein AMXMBFR84_39180 [Candidatus Hydrogenedentota bacterium]